MFRWSMVGRYTCSLPPALLSCRKRATAAPTLVRQLKSTFQIKPPPQVLLEPPALQWLSLAMLDTAVVGLGRVAQMDFLLARPAAPTRARQLKSVIRRKPIPEVSLEPPVIL